IAELATSAQCSEEHIQDLAKENSKSNENFDLIIERLFHILDKNHDGSINLKEFILFFILLEGGNADKMLEISFTLLDQSNDGYITYNELVNFMEMLVTISLSYFTL
ncbi:unnamed protein product, partial [Rotaria sordida]